MSYLVVRLDNQTHHCPKVKHVTIDEAMIEAERLAGKHPGSCFVCAEIICAYQTQPTPKRVDEEGMPLKVKPNEN